MTKPCRSHLLDDGSQMKEKTGILGPLSSVYPKYSNGLSLLSWWDLKVYMHERVPLSILCKFSNVRRRGILLLKCLNDAGNHTNMNVIM